MNILDLKKNENLFWMDIMDFHKMNSFFEYSVSSLGVPKMEEEFSGTGAVKNSKSPDKSW